MAALSNRAPLHFVALTHKGDGIQLLGAGVMVVLVRLDTRFTYTCDVVCRQAMLIQLLDNMHL
ncbi:hypothetical protein F2Q69_00039943 [Brassica cretica]|uniref:Uncharacterized protein n=1 Tax=Brassica cretica TaxID=69181 RepID=A0A8S9ND58_BRACR|nr:hypothetical protein F2Q69_00039943 [Brassica cretica]